MAKKKKAAKKSAAKTPSKKSVKKNATSKSAPKSKNTPIDQDDFDDLAVYTLASPDQPVDYDIVEAASRQELIQHVRERLFIMHDGCAWIPQGPAFAKDGSWYQTMVKFD